MNSPLLASAQHWENPMRCLPMALIAMSLLLSGLAAASERAQRYHELYSQAYPRSGRPIRAIGRPTAAP